MALNAKQVKYEGGKGGVAQEAIEAGTYAARLVQVLDLGLQAQRPYQGKEKAPVQEIMLTYELLDEFMKDENGEDIEDKPRWVSETMAFHSLEAELAKSTKRYMALDPKLDHDGDFTQLVDTPCMVTVVQSPGKGANAGKVYNNVGSVAPMRPKDAAKAPELQNPPKVFVLDEPDMEIFGSLPQWVQDKIKSNLEFEGSELQKALNGGKKADKEEAKADPKGKAKKAQEEAPEDEEDDQDDIPW